MASGQPVCPKVRGKRVSQGGGYGGRESRKANSDECEVGDQPDIGFRHRVSSKIHVAFGLSTRLNQFPEGSFTITSTP